MRFVALVIDMQEDFFTHERLSQRRAVLSRRVNELVGICRESNTPVVWVKQEFASDLSDATLEARKRGTPMVIEGTPGAAILPELDHRPSDRTIIKKRYSAFFGTDLDEVLMQFQPVQLIVAGINTHACVRTAVVDAYQRDYEVVLARDCIESHDAAHHEISWNYMDGKLGTGMSNEQIRSLLSGVTPESAAHPER